MMEAHPDQLAIAKPAFRRVPVLNAFVHDVSMADLLDRPLQGMILTLHPDMLVKLQTDRAFYDTLRHFDMVTCDSQILYKCLSLMGTPVRERVSGSDFFPLFYERHRENPDVTIFMLGGAPGVPDEARRRINKKVGREMVVGVAAPPKGFENDPCEVEKVVAQVNASGASVLVVGLGGGRQEKFIVANRHRFTCTKLFLPLGGTVDYEAGALARPAPWVTNAGLEWAYRVIMQPRKRWKRYLVEQPPVLWWLWKQKRGSYRNPFAG